MSLETLLFVYGTLRRGGAQERLLIHLRPVATTQTLPSYTLLDLHNFPALIEGGETAVVGE